MTAVLSYGRAAHDKFRLEAASAMCLAGRPDMSGPVVNPVTGATEEFKRPNGIGSSSVAIAKQVLVQCGADAGDVMDATDIDIARVAFGDRHRARELFGEGFAANIGNVTGQYQNLMLDAGNMQLRKSYIEVSTTYQVWATRSEDIANYDPAHFVSVGGFPDPTVIGEDGEFDEVSTVDAKETMQVHEFGMRATWSFKLLANDRLGAILGTQSKKMGAAFKRKENRLVYAQLKDNAALADGIALFHGSAVGSGGHANLTTGAISDYSAAMNVLSQKMGAQVGLGTNQSPLGITTKFVLHPPALDQTFFELLESPTRVTGTTPGVPNYFRGRAQSVVEHELATQFGGSDSAFYAIGDPAMCESVVYAYLAGQNGPVFDLFERPGVLGLGSKMHMAFGAKAVDYRPVQKHTGA